MLGISVNKHNRDRLPAYGRAGFSVAELLLPAASGTPDALGELLAYGAETAALIREAGLELRTVHMPFSLESWNPCHPEEGKCAAAVEGQSRLLHAVAAWGAPYAVMHVSCGPVQEEDRPAREMICTQSLTQMAREAQICGVRILAENLPKQSLVNGSAALLRVTENGKLADICFDVNHLFLESHEEFIQAAGAFVCSTHLSDYDGTAERHWLPGRGIVPWRQVVEGLTAVGYEGPWLFELGLDEAGVPHHPTRIVEEFERLKKL